MRFYSLFPPLTCFFCYQGPFQDGKVTGSLSLSLSFPPILLFISYSLTSFCFYCFNLWFWVLGTCLSSGIYRNERLGVCIHNLIYKMFKTKSVIYSFSLCDIQTLLSKLEVSGYDLAHAESGRRSARNNIPSGCYHYTQLNRERWLSLASVSPSHTCRNAARFIKRQYACTVCREL